MEEQKDEKKNFWQKFNPSIREMMEKNPNYSVLGVWWSFTWRIWVLAAAVWFFFAILVVAFSALLGR